MNTFISPALDAADLLALARLEDDGAPPAVSPPETADGPRSHAIRVARTGQPATSQAEATGPAGSQQARQAASAGLGTAGLRLPVSPEPRHSRTGFYVVKSNESLLRSDAPFGHDDRFGLSPHADPTPLLTRFRD